MKSIIKILLLSYPFALMSSCELQAQKAVREYQISLPDTKIKNSLYNKIEFIDSRKDTGHFGIVSVGDYNIKAKVIASPPLEKQLSDVVSALTDGTANQGELLFQLRKLKFGEAAGKKTFCNLRAQLYSKTNDGYKKLQFVDTVIAVTTGIFKKSSKLITGFIADALNKAPAESDLYTLNDVMNIEEIEKRKIPLYNPNTYKEGLYITKEAFFKQKADKPAIVEMKEGKIDKVQVVDEIGEKEKVKPRNIYAVVYEGSPYIATEFGYFPLRKENNDFYFSAKIRMADAGAAVATGVMFGLVGALLVAAASETEKMVEMKLDHLTGQFIIVDKAASR